MFGKRLLEPVMVPVRNAAALAMWSFVIALVALMVVIAR
jgi:hypothetical protein